MSDAGTIEKQEKNEYENFLEGNPQNDEKLELKWEALDHHDEIARKVYRRLRLRNVQLKKAEEEALEYTAHDEAEEIHKNQKEKNENIIIVEDHRYKVNNQENEKAKELLPPRLRAYHLAVTDLFVEKAQAYLEAQADGYSKWGYRANISAIIIIFIGALAAIYQMVVFTNNETNEFTWQYIIIGFTRAFTAYGMIVLIAVGLWRFGKAMLDQAERLLERRHALRQGRLFVHLSDGRLTIEELEKAFNWNMTQNNAFADIKTEAQAPWGVVLKELVRIMPEIIKNANPSADKIKSDINQSVDSGSKRRKTNS